VGAKGAGVTDEVDACGAGGGPAACAAGPAVACVCRTGTSRPKLPSW
jgi:hypothetical protein